MGSVKTKVVKSYQCTDGKIFREDECRNAQRLAEQRQEQINKGPSLDTFKTWLDMPDGEEDCAITSEDKPVIIMGEHSEFVIQSVYVDYYGWIYIDIEEKEG